MSRKIATLWRRAWKVAAAIAVAYLAVCVGFYLLQDRRLFPGRPTQGQPHAVLAPSPEYELVRFSTSDGDPIVAIFGRAQDEIGRERADAPSRPTMLYFYGNSTCLADSLADFRAVLPPLVTSAYGGLIRMSSFFEPLLPSCESAMAWRSAAGSLLLRL